MTSQHGGPKRYSTLRTKRTNAAAANDVTTASGANATAAVDLTSSAKTAAGGDSSAYPGGKDNVSDVIKTSVDNVVVVRGSSETLKGLKFVVIF